MAPRQAAGDSACVRAHWASAKDQHFSSLAAGGALDAAAHHCHDDGQQHGPRSSRNTAPIGAEAHPYHVTTQDKHDDVSHDNWYLGAYRDPSLPAPTPSDYSPDISPAGSAPHTLPEPAHSPPSGTYSITHSPNKQQPQHQVMDGMVLGAAAPSAGVATRDFIDKSMIADYLQILRLQQEQQQRQEAQRGRGSRDGRTAAASGAGDVRRSLSASDAAASAAIQAAAAAEHRPSTPQPQPHGTSETATGAMATSALAGAAAAAVVAGGGLGRKAASDDENMVTRFIGYIKEWKLAKAEQAAAAPLKHGDAGSSSSSLASTAHGSAKGVAADSASKATNVKIWIQPSGPRRPGEGTENEEQGILSAEEVKGEVMLHITLLAAGFVIGPSGASVRDIMRHTGADIKSWTENSDLTGKRRARIFLIGGDARSVAQAVYVITAAVDRYKELCEGRYSGQSVERAQCVLGVEFSYQPPPKTIVPYAASLKGMHPALLNKLNQKASPVKDQNLTSTCYGSSHATTPSNGSTGAVMYPGTYQSQMAAAAAQQMQQGGQAASAQFPMQQLPGIYAPVDPMEQYQQQLQMGMMMGVVPGGKPMTMAPANTMQMGVMGAPADMYGATGSVFGQQQYLPVGPPSPGSSFHAAAMMATAYHNLGTLQPGQVYTPMGPGLVPAGSLTSYGSLGSQLGSLELSSAGLLQQQQSWDAAPGMPFGHQPLNGQQLQYYQDPSAGPHSNGTSPAAALPSSPPTLRRRNSNGHHSHHGHAQSHHHHTQGTDTPTNNMTQAPSTPRGSHPGAAFMGPPGPMFTNFVPTNGQGGLVYPSSPGGGPMMGPQMPFGSVMGFAPVQQMQQVQQMAPLSPMPSPLKVMQAKGGAVPYLELGGCAYFPSNGGLPSPRMMPNSPGSIPPGQQNARSFMPHAMQSLFADNPYLDLGAIGGNLHHSSNTNGNTYAGSNGGGGYARSGRGSGGRSGSGGRGGRGGSSGNPGGACSTPRNRGGPGMRAATRADAGSAMQGVGNRGGTDGGTNNIEVHRLPPRPPSVHSARSGASAGSDSDTIDSEADLLLAAAIRMRHSAGGAAFGAGAMQQGQQGQLQAQQQQGQPGHRRSKAMSRVPAAAAVDELLTQLPPTNERISGGGMDGGVGQQQQAAGWAGWAGNAAGPDAVHMNDQNGNSSAAMGTIHEGKPYDSGAAQNGPAGACVAAGGGRGSAGNESGGGGSGDDAPRRPKPRPVLPPLVLPSHEDESAAAVPAGSGDSSAGGPGSAGAIAGGLGGGGPNTPIKQPKLDATDPIVSPGRITVACKVKSARFSKAAQQARQQLRGAAHPN